MAQFLQTALQVRDQSLGRLRVAFSFMDKNENELVVGRTRSPKLIKASDRRRQNEAFYGFSCIVAALDSSVLCS